MKNKTMIITGFDEKAYLDANPDVVQAIKDGTFKDAQDHLAKLGLREIEEGKRRFHKDFAPFNEKKYLNTFQDVKKAVDTKKFISAFEHFAKYGYREILNGKRAAWQNFGDTIGTMQKKLLPAKNEISSNCKTFITNLGKIATFNGGLTNSAIDRIKRLSEVDEYKNDEFIIFYCSEVQSTKEINEYYIKKYSMPNKVKFINALDFINSFQEFELSFEKHEMIKNRYKKYVVNGLSMGYDEFVYFSLLKLLDRIDNNLIYLFMDVPLTPDYRILITDVRVRKIFLTHSEHLLKYKTQNSHWKKSFYKGRNYFQPIQDSKTYTVSFTEMQNKYITKREGYKKNYQCIPHYYEIRKIYNIEREDKLIWLGRISNKDKKIKLAIDSYMKSGIDNPFEIYGDGYDLENMKKYVMEKGYENKIKFFGKIDNIDMVLQSSKLFISITEYEGFGLSILEALRNGCPVLASNVLYGPKELIDNGRNGYLVKNDIDDISLKLREYFQHNKFDTFHVNAIKSSDKYSLDNYIKKWKNLISHLQKSISIKNLSDLKFKIFLKNNKIIINIEGALQVNEFILLRAYDKHLNDSSEYTLNILYNEIDLFKVENKLLSIIHYNAHKSKEKGLLIENTLDEESNNSICYRKETIIANYNTTKEFNFVLIDNKKIKNLDTA